MPPAPAPPIRHRAAHGHVPDTGVTARDVSHALPPWHDIRPPHTAETKPAPPPDTLRCSSDSTDAAEKTGVHSPSIDNADDARHNRRPLEKRTTDKHPEVGPRESRLPTGQVSEGSPHSSPRRFFISASSLPKRCPTSQSNSQAPPRLDPRGPLAPSLPEAMNSDAASRLRKTGSLFRRAPQSASGTGRFAR